MTYLAIEGPISVGKTTLARLVGARLDLPVLLERFEENPFLRGYTLSTRAASICVPLSGELHLNADKVHNEAARGITPI